MATLRYVRRAIAYALLVAMPLLLSWGLPGCIGSIPCKPTPFTAQVRSYFLDFKPGSYWIYRNIQNGDIDSVYFVSQSMFDADKPECQTQYSTTILKGFAGDKQFGYYITSWNNTIENNQSDIHLNTDYDTGQAMSSTVNGKVYAQSIRLTHCCVAGSSSCYKPGCDFKIFRFLNVVFASNVGLIRWEAENYPGFGTVTYELVRSNIVR
jgi:hypothetical protein